jgi:hypothetical protein
MRTTSSVETAQGIVDSAEHDSTIQKRDLSVSFKSLVDLARDYLEIREAHPPMEIELDELRRRLSWSIFYKP